MSSDRFLLLAASTTVFGTIKLNLFRARWALGSDDHRDDGMGDITKQRWYRVDKLHGTLDTSTIQAAT